MRCDEAWGSAQNFTCATRRQPDVDRFDRVARRAADPDLVLAGEERERRAAAPALGTVDEDDGVPGGPRPRASPWPVGRSAVETTVVYVTPSGSPGRAVCTGGGGAVSTCLASGDASEKCITAQPPRRSPRRTRPSAMPSLARESDGRLAWSHRRERMSCRAALAERKGATPRRWGWTPADRRSCSAVAGVVDRPWPRRARGSARAWASVVLVGGGGDVRRRSIGGRSSRAARAAAELRRLRRAVRDLAHDRVLERRTVTLDVALRTRHAAGLGALAERFSPIGDRTRADRSQVPSPRHLGHRSCVRGANFARVSACWASRTPRGRGDPSPIASSIAATTPRRREIARRGPRRARPRRALEHERYAAASPRRCARATLRTSLGIARR